MEENLAILCNITESKYGELTKEYLKKCNKNEETDKINRMIYGRAHYNTIEYLKEINKDTITYVTSNSKYLDKCSFIKEICKILFKVIKNKEICDEINCILSTYNFEEESNCFCFSACNIIEDGEIKFCNIKSMINKNAPMTNNYFLNVLHNYN